MEGGREDGRWDRGRRDRAKYKEVTAKDGHGVGGVAWRQKLLGAVHGGDHFLSLGTSLCQEWGQKRVSG